MLPCTFLLDIDSAHFSDVVHFTAFLQCQLIFLLWILKYVVLTNAYLIARTPGPALGKGKVGEREGNERKSFLIIPILIEQCLFSSEIVTFMAMLWILCGSNMLVQGNIFIVGND